MRKLAVILFQLAVIASGCVAQKTAVNVDQNRIHFTLPKLTLELDAAYLYQDGGKDRKFSFFDDGGTTGTGISTERHFFHNSTSSANHVIIVAYSTLNRARTEFNPIAFDRYDGLLDKGKEVFDGVEMKYGVFPFLSDKDECYLKKDMVTIVGAGGNRLLQITYIEKVAYRSDFPYRCSEWDDPRSLTPAQKERLEQFLENSRKEIKAAAR